MRELLLIGIGGFLGAVLRYVISGIIPVKFGIPSGTLTVNLIGSLIMGFVLYSCLLVDIPVEWKILITTGFCGALTTFSTFSYETFSLMDEGYLLKAFYNVFLNVAGCLLMIYVGRQISYSIFNISL
ncbi:fluoride efflux transporter CrcB [Methanococcus voltae]|uniref:Fluoride-specific ion channel FluC n=2 Tax=Methanococcus voltae TaxID=2188 RepID=A0A8J7RHF4_METVO|nr:fluoride efflux transporter CrcB [Methanococcus voltae]MBP2172528.1 CrcB protein [Methanococcus voltae]MBP2201565.1 CrcB protein [Methanococcus voltae]MCS3922354.1 CrcB protein [Methanococcus voltae PS]